VVIVFLVLQPPYGAVAAGNLKQEDADRGTVGEEDWALLIKFIGRDRSIGHHVRRSTPRWHFGWLWRVGRARHASTHLPRASDEDRGISRHGTSQSHINASRLYQDNLGLTTM
jgi:hypothetical protein